MKKFLFLILFFTIFVFSFSKEVFLKKIELEKIKTILIGNGFIFKDESTYYFFERREGKLNEKVDILLKDDEIPYGIGIIVSCHNLNVDQLKLKKRLIILVETLNEGIIDNELKNNMMESLKKMPEETSMKELDIVPYMKKTNNIYDNGDYYIVTASRESGKSIKIIFEPYLTK